MPYTYGGDTLVFSNDSCVIFVAPDTIIWDKDTACVVICDSLGNCDTTIIIYCAIDTCTDSFFAVDSIIIPNCDGDSIIPYCFDITMAEAMDLVITIDGVPYTGGLGNCMAMIDRYYDCSFDPSLDTCMVIVMTEDLVKNGTDTILYSSTSYTSLGALGDSLAVHDPSGGWTYDGGYLLSTTDDVSTYTSLVVASGCSMDTTTIPLTSMVYYTGTELYLPGPDSCFYLKFEDTITGCVDSVKIDIYGPGDDRCPDTVIAVDDYATTTINTPITINILDNDTIGCVNADTVYIITDPTKGTAVINTDQTATYTPSTDSCDYTDSFEYVVCCDTVCDTAWVYVTVECEPVIDTIYVLNGFSPNSDGINDYWEILPYNLCDDITVQIFSRWGNTVYESDNYVNDWDGRWSKTGESVPTGTYYYVVTFGDDCTGTYYIKRNKEDDPELVDIQGLSISGYIMLTR